MQATIDSGSAPSKNPFLAPKFYGISLIVAAIVLSGFFLVTRYITVDVARDMRTWQEKLNLIAESRSAEVTRAVADRFKDLRGLSENPSLQLYLTELQAMSDDGAGKNNEPPAQLEYLRNLLVFTAQRGGYMSAQGGETIAANVESEYKGGLAILGKNGELVVSTNMPQAVKERILAAASLAAPDKESLIDMQRADEGTIYMGFSMPIYSIQGERSSDAIVGRVVALRRLDGEFWDLLKHPGVTEQTLEAVLVRHEQEKIEFLSPLLDRSEALSKEIDNDKNRFVEARLLDTVGDFSSDMKDYAKKKVLATSRSISGTPWTLLVKVESAEALKASTANRNNMIAIFLCVIVVIALTIIAIWWHAISKRSLLLSHHYRKLAAEAHAQERLLRLVADNQPQSILIVDEQRQVQFANRPMVEAVGMSPEAVVGKTLADVRGGAKAEEHVQPISQALSRGQVVYHQFHAQEFGVPHVVRAAYVPLSHIPVAHLPEPTPGVLVIEQDITEVINEREKRLQISQDLIDTLVTLVDRRDPFAANHSLMVSGLAQRVAEQMELDGVTIDTARIAGSLMNIGKIVISTRLLTKTDTLTDEERGIIRNSLIDAAELVKNIHFEGPVYETLRQWQEKWDGSGALGFAGERILMSARILAVANTFIGMISPRSWRDAISTEKATTYLMEHCGTLFDRRVVVALVHFLENHHGKEWLAQMNARRDAA